MRCRPVASPHRPAAATGAAPRRGCCTGILAHQPPAGGHYSHRLLLASASLHASHAVTVQACFPSLRASPAQRLLLAEQLPYNGSLDDASPTARPVFPHGSGVCSSHGTPGRSLGFLLAAEGCAAARDRDRRACVSSSRVADHDPPGTSLQSGDAPAIGGRAGPGPANGARGAFPDPHCKGNYRVDRLLSSGSPLSIPRQTFPAPQSSRSSQRGFEVRTRLHARFSSRGLMPSSSALLPRRDCVDMLGRTVQSIGGTPSCTRVREPREPEGVCNASTEFVDVPICQANAIYWRCFYMYVIIRGLSRSLAIG